MNVRMIWVDADCPPVFEWTAAEVDGQAVFATWTEAKARALESLRGAQLRIASAIADTRRMTRADVTE